MTSPTPLSLQPIGYFRCNKKQPYEAASQGSLDNSEEIGIIELLPGQNFEQALRGLAQMSHLWVLFWFHHNEHWRPLVSVPRGTQEKQGLFATRSPYRPNPLGLSLVRIEKIEQRRIFVRGFDLLDETPILDLKPFHPEADVAGSDLSLGWMEKLSEDEFSITTQASFDKELSFLTERGVNQLLPFCEQQLRFDPFNDEKKRVSYTPESKTGILAYRTWRIHFVVQDKSIALCKLKSGYSEDDLREMSDKWKDKDLHREFVKLFGR